MAGEDEALLPGQRRPLFRKWAGVVVAVGAVVALLCVSLSAPEAGQLLNSKQAGGVPPTARQIAQHAAHNLKVEQQRAEQMEHDLALQEVRDAARPLEMFSTAKSQKHKEHHEGKSSRKWQQLQDSGKIVAKTSIQVPRLAKLVPSGWPAFFQTTRINLPVSQASGIDTTVHDNMVLQHTEPVVGVTCPTGSVDKKFKAVIKQDGANGTDSVFVSKPLSCRQDGADLELQFAALTPSEHTHTMEVFYDNKVVAKAENVLVGSVILCGGQSNMAMTMNHMYVKNKIAQKDQMAEVTKLLATKDLSLIRGFRTGINGYYGGKGGLPWPHPYQLRDWIDFTKAPTEVLDTSSVCLFTALAFTDKLPKGVHHPIGFISEAVSATRIECWIPMSSVEKCDPIYKAFPTFERIANPGSITGQCGWKNAGLERASLFEERIAPIIAGTRLAAAVFYQGEQNVNDRREAYGCSYNELVKSYRTAFKGNFPWIAIQIAPTGNDNTFAVRTAQKAISDQVECVSLVVTNDLGSTFDGRKRHSQVDQFGEGPKDGSGADIHPIHKQDVGERVATQLVSILGLVKSDKYISGPAYASASWNSAKLHLQFNQALGLRWVAAKECGAGPGAANCCAAKNTMVRLSKTAVKDIGKKTVWESAPSAVNAQHELVATPAAGLQLDFNSADYKSMQILYEDYPECVLKNKEGLSASPVLVALGETDAPAAVVAAAAVVAKPARVAVAVVTPVAQVVTAAATPAKVVAAAVTGGPVTATPAEVTAGAVDSQVIAGAAKPLGGPAALGSTKKVFVGGR